MINDISAFIACGKRFSVDIKLHGVGTVLDYVQCESYDLDCDFDLVEHFVPRVIELLKASRDSNAVKVLKDFESSISMMEYSSDVYKILLRLTLDIMV